MKVTPQPLTFTSRGVQMLTGSTEVPKVRFIQIPRKFRTTIISYSNMTSQSLETITAVKSKVVAHCFRYPPTKKNSSLFSSPVYQAHHCGAFNPITCTCLLQCISHSHHVFHIFSMLLDIVRIKIQIYINMTYTRMCTGFVPPPPPPPPQILVSSWSEEEKSTVPSLGKTE